MVEVGAGERGDGGPKRVDGVLILGGAESGDR